MSSQYLKEVKSQAMEETMSEAPDGTINTSECDLNRGLNELDPNNTPTDGDQPGFEHLHKKAEVTHPLISYFEKSSNGSNSNSADSDISNSSSCSNESNTAKILQSSRSCMCPEELSAGRQTTTVPREYSGKMVQENSIYETSDEESPSPPASEIFPARYRQTGPDLMTLHMFTGEMNGKRPIYVPVYKRDNGGKLLKLMKSWSGRWGYMEPKELMGEEVDEGMKILEEPEAEVVMQSSEPKKAVGRRTLADFGLPETNPNGGWGWLGGSPK
ncbi:MAG: hypothetical protein Q9175_004072 [Cornicularia normoerica]